MDKFIAALQNFAVSSKDEYNHLDGLQGDGDLGITLELMVEALVDASKESANLKSWLIIGGTKVRKNAPSTMGVLVSFALSAAGKALPEDAPLDANTFSLLQKVMIEEIKKRGGADVGDRTVLDAFVPAYQAYSKAVQDGASQKEALECATKAAFDGAEATRKMAPKTGRASWVGDRTLGQIDGGALLCYNIYKLICDLK